MQAASGARSSSTDGRIALRGQKPCGGGRWGRRPSVCCQATAFRLLALDDVFQPLVALSYWCRAKSASRARPLRWRDTFVVLLPVDVVEGGEAVLVICWTWLVSGSIKAFDALALRVASPLVSMALNSATLAARGLLRDIGV